MLYTFLKKKRMSKMKLANYYPVEVEAMKLGYGRQKYIVSILGCDRKTI